jgi:lactate dehydrogenase-like 2-hydroxyacid dehydrogenase
MQSCTQYQIIDTKVVDAAGSNLKVISSCTTGVDHIDMNKQQKEEFMLLLQAIYLQKQANYR